MHPLTCHSFRLYLALLALMMTLALVPACSAQAMVNPLQDGGTRIADGITRAKLKTVIVFDFSGPDNHLTQLGLDLAANFRAVLAKSGPRFRVENAQQVSQRLADHFYAPEVVLYPDWLLAPAQDLGVNGFVSGQLSIAGDKITLDISAYRCKDGKGVGAVKISWPLSDDLRALSDGNLLEKTRDSDGAPILASGAKGYTMPKCLYCPRADYSGEALRHKYQGVVELMAVVERDGTIGNIRVIKPLPYGLSLEAINAVRKWKLDPALGPDGKPAPVRQIIEVTFQLY